MFFGKSKINALTQDLLSKEEELAIVRAANESMRMELKAQNTAITTLKAEIQSLEMAKLNLLGELRVLTETYNKRIQYFEDKINTKPKVKSAKASKSSKMNLKKKANKVNTKGL